MIYLCNYTKNLFYVNVKRTCQNLVYSVSSSGKNEIRGHDNIDLGKVDIDTQKLYSHCVNSMIFEPIGVDQYVQVAYNNKTLLPYLRHATDNEIDEGLCNHDFFILAVDRKGKKITNIQNIEIAKFIMADDVFIVSGMVDQGDTAHIETYDYETQTFITYIFKNTNGINNEVIALNIENFKIDPENVKMVEAKRYNIIRHIPLVPTEIVIILEKDINLIDMSIFNKYNYPRFVVIPTDLTDERNRDLAEYVIEGIKRSGYEAISVFGKSYEIMKNFPLLEMIQRRFLIKHIIEPSGKILRMQSLPQFRRKETETDKGSLI